MKVVLTTSWFGPSEPADVGGRVISGQYFPRGEHEMPDWLYDHLPKSATVTQMPTGHTPTPVPPVREPSFKDYDEARMEGEAEAKVITKAQENMAKARAARLRNINLRKAAALDEEYKV